MTYLGKARPQGVGPCRRRGVARSTLPLLDFAREPDPVAIVALAVKVTACMYSLTSTDRDARLWGPIGYSCAASAGA